MENNLFPERYNSDDYNLDVSFDKIVPITSLSNDKTFNIAARVTAKRIHGAMSFIDVYDYSSAIQCIFYISEVNFSDINIGDFLLLTGSLTTTKSGVLSFHVSKFSFLSKNLLPLQKAYYASDNKEVQYRERIRSSLIDREIFEQLVIRNKVIAFIRNFFTSKSFIEVETPILQSVPSGGPTINTFNTYYNSLKKDMFLRVAPECYLKRMIISGYERIFEIARCFRNEGISRVHSPEFTMLEAYIIMQNCSDMMHLTENLINELLEQFKLDRLESFKRISYLDFMKSKVGEVNSKESVKELFDIYNMTEKMIWNSSKCDNENINECLFILFSDYFSDHISEPTFITDFPSSDSLMTKRFKNKEFFADRAELYCSGMEIANMSTEINDPVLQFKLFANELHKDTQFLNDMFLGMPPLGGVGIGIDRLVMFVINLLKKSNINIRDVIFFPTLK